MENRTLNILDFKLNPKSQEIAEALRRDGVLVLKDFCAAEVLEKLKKDFASLMENQPNNEWLENRPYSLGKAVLLTRNESMKRKLPDTYDFFFNAKMQEIADLYLGMKFKANQKIFVVKDTVGSVHNANDLHFDIERTLKFFLYLTDTTEKNGAFRCVPGSHKDAERIRKENPDQISYENREFSRKLPFGPEHTIPVNGKAGSLIIFDTNVFHQAGKVSEGERWVMRGQTEAIKAKTKPKPTLLRRLLNKFTK
jgi:ectoine hydroxylase-related dioxygenase (phytanoyl-CoA dioxygenase family)